MDKQDITMAKNGGVLHSNILYRSFQGGGFIGVTGWEPLRDSPLPNDHINNELAKLISRDSSGNTVVNPNITSTGRAISSLERLFKKVEPKADFSKFFSFLAHTAEAESFSGAVTESKKSSASGDFHILTDNTKGGGTSSFDTGKQRIRNLKKKFGNILSSDPGVIETLDKILVAKSPADLSKEEQAIFVFADLKMKSNNLNHFLSGKLSDVDLYSREWVTEGSNNHSKAGISTNWVNAGTRRAAIDDILGADEKYFGISTRDIDPAPINIKDEVGKIKFNQRSNLDNLSPVYRSGGKLSHNNTSRLDNIRKRSKLF